MPIFAKRKTQPAECPKCHAAVDLRHDLNCPACARPLFGLRTRAQERRLRAEHDAQDLRAIRNQWNAAAIGTMLLAMGLCTTAINLPTGGGTFGARFAVGYAAWRAYGLFSLVTIGWIIYRRMTGEPVHRWLLVLGIAWMAIGLGVVVAGMLI
jgi:hypothetical protein